MVKKSTQFKKDYKRCQKQGQNMDLLKDIVATLSIPALLPPEKNDHQLSSPSDSPQSLILSGFFDYKSNYTFDCNAP
ncbi:MAG: type II toxin-antitoxin system YafQ family toxin [Lachnospiraceae bacterium]|nr:type II toxin-antitoxin system YafQ family toxin [Lachnospiraceae bacterium]